MVSCRYVLTFWCLQVHSGCKVFCQWILPSCWSPQTCTVACARWRKTIKLLLFSWGMTSVSMHVFTRRTCVMNWCCQFWSFYNGRSEDQGFVEGSLVPWRHQFAPWKYSHLFSNRPDMCLQHHGIFLITSHNETIIFSSALFFIGQVVTEVEKVGIFFRQNEYFVKNVYRD